MKKVTSIIIAICVIVACLFIGYLLLQPAPTVEKELTREVVDMNGDVIKLPETVDSYIDLWYSHQSVMAMLDNCERMKATSYDRDNVFCAWLFEMYPDVPSASIEDMTVEEILELDVDVVFWEISTFDTQAKQLNDAGVAAVNINFDDYESMKRSITLVAEVLNTDYARAQAEKFNAELDETINTISNRISTIPEEEKVRVLNLRNFDTLRADGKKTVADSWINICGGTNVVSVVGNQYLNNEQIFEWNPDIIFSSATGDAEWVYSQDAYSDLKAVQDKNVYDNPAGLHYWNRCSTETILQLNWAASIFYPEIFGDIDMNQVIRDYYKEYYNYEISDENIQQMLNVLPPVGWEE